MKRSPVKNFVFKYILITCGFMSVGLGVLGIFLPVLPTTPFLLFAAFCFARSSDKFYRWLLDNRLFGPYLKGYIEKKSIPLGIKIYAITLLWLGITVTIVFFIGFWPARVMLLAVAAAVTAHIISLKTR